MDRSVSPTAEVFADDRVNKGRPVGFEALWILKGSKSNADCCIDKTEHGELKSVLRLPEFWQERKNARTDLWSLRHQHPSIIRLFRMEAQVPETLLRGSEPELWEPLLVS